ncbi:hypothetical protein [Acidiphilium sp.]
MSAAMIDAVDEFRKAQSDLPSRPEAVRRMLTEYLRHCGLLK